MKEIGIGVLGFGTVGAGVVETLLSNGDLLADRTGVRLTLRKVADLDLETDRGVEIDRSLLTTDAQSVIDDPDIQIIVELVGGMTVAKEFTLQSLRKGKAVVTANKALLAEHASEIFAAADECQSDLFYEASVGGGMPIIRSLREGLIANHIQSMYGILNGTCNYILTRMEAEGLPFDKVLEEAQAMGFAEAEPSLDVDGIDTAHKAALLASLAYGFTVPFEEIHVEGIRGIDQQEISYASQLGYRIKLLSIIKHLDDGVDIRVHPTLVSADHMLGKVDGVFNAVMVTGDVVGETMYYGKGAGRGPTASAVVADIADVARNLVSQSSLRVPALVQHREDGRLRSIGESELRCYLRLSLLDRPCVLSSVAEILGRHAISIASVMQQESRAGEHVPVIMITHGAKEALFQRAVEEIDRLESVGAPTVRLRIEDFDA